MDTLNILWSSLPFLSSLQLETFEFGRPVWLLALPLLILLWWRRTRPGPVAAVKFSSLTLLKAATHKTRARRGHWPLILRTLALALILLALAEPRVEKGKQDEKAEGIDVMLVLDASKSMDSKDFDFDGKKLSRREALERVLGEFIQARPNDRIGVVGFAERPFMISPLTLDHSWMMEAMGEVETTLGTAIGSAVESSVDLLRKGESPNKVAIVVTDGLNTSGVDPLQSAYTAQRFGVRLYTIGVVSYAQMLTSNLDELTLSKMARMTGGQFFQAANGGSLRSIYGQIDQMEKREIKQTKLRAFQELFQYFAGMAFVLLVLELLLTQGRKMRLP
jgi:Ca-activated chloride channel family protein